MLKESLDNIIVDLGWVTRYTLTYEEKLRKASVIFMTKYLVKPEDDEFDTLLIRCMKLQDTADILIDWRLKVDPEVKMGEFRRWIKCLKALRCK